LAVAAFRSGPTRVADESPLPEASPIPALTGEPRITAEIPLLDPEGDDVLGGIAVGAGSAWVSHPRGEAGSIIRIDLATNEVAAEIPLQGAAWRKRIAATDDVVWVASSGVLERIDPTTNTVVASVELPDRSISAITADDAAVWMVTIGDDGGILVRIDPATNEITAEIPLGPEVAGYEDEVVLGSGAVWVLGVRWFEEEDAEYGSDLIRIDPATNTVAARIPVGAFHMVMGEDDVWVRFPADGVFDDSNERWLWTRVDVGTNEPSAPFAFEDDGLRLAAPDALWSVGYDD
jgi:DNA-binding beta-propeller fold protein YncE